MSSHNFKHPAATLLYDMWTLKSHTRLLGEITQNHNCKVNKANPKGEAEERNKQESTCLLLVKVVYFSI